MNPPGDQLSGQLRAAYVEAGLNDYWAVEQGPAVRACQALAGAIAPRYAVLGPLAVGGGGITLLLEDHHFNGKKAVAKLARPVLGDEERMNALLHDEAQKLVTANHPNVIHIRDVGEVADAGGGQRVYYYLMDYIEGASDALEYLSAEPTEDRVIEILDAALSGLDYIHSDLKLVHTDIKPGNLFCSNSGEIVVADFGFAKKLGDEGITLYVGGTSEFMHPSLQDYIEELTSSKRDTREENRTAAREYPRSGLDTQWDIYSLGVTTLYLLSVLDRLRPIAGQNYKRRYLRLMAYRMLDGQVSYAHTKNARVKIRLKGQQETIPLNIPETILGLPRGVLRATRYLSAADVLGDLQKLRGERNLMAAIPELSRHLDQVVNAASHSPVPFTERVRDVVNAPEVRSLGNLPQLGLVRFVYPTASHSRLEHTLGAFAMVARLIATLYDDPVNPLFRQLMTEEDLKAGLIMALVHDIGHYPLAHDLEEVSRAVFSHEARTLHLLNAPSSQLRQIIEKKWEVPVSRVSEILSADTQGDDAIKNQILRSMIDGPIDADKMDYVIRDSENLRLPYGRGADYEKLLQSVTVVVTEDAQRRCHGQIGIQESGRTAAESLAFARYALYGVSYWHRTHRTVKAMLNRVAYGVLETAYADKGRENYSKIVRAELDEALSRGTELRLPVEDSALATSFHVDTGAEAILRWLQARTDPGSRHLVDDLLDRRLVKRILVCSQTHRDSGGLDWPAVRRVFGEVGENWRERLRIARAIASRLAEFVAEWDEGQRVPGSQATTTLAESFVRDVHAGKAVLLIDFPPMKKGSTGGLRFLREEEWSEGVVDSFRVDSVGESPVWKAVTESGYTAVAKLRVFCDERYAAVVSQAVTRDRFERIVDEVIREAG